MFFYVRDLSDKTIWSATQQPVRKPPDRYEAIYRPEGVNYLRQDGRVVTRTEVMVSPKYPAEIRKISITNESGVRRGVEITSYLEVVLAPFGSDLSHPAFSNLFIETEYVRKESALLCSRRPRSSKENRFWMVHRLTGIDGVVPSQIEYETDRNRFIGRGRTTQFPRALDPGMRLSNTVGAVLDPVMSLRCVLLIPPGKSAGVVYVTGAGFDRASVLSMTGKI